MIDHTPSTGIMAELGLTSEAATAEELGMKPPALAKKRKQGGGRAPDHVIIARKVYYSRDAKRRWIEAGGERQPELPHRKMRKPAQAPEDRRRAP